MDNDVKEFEEKEIEHEKALEVAIEKQDNEKLKDIVEQMHPIDIAIALEDSDDEDLTYIYSKLNDEQIAEIIEQADEELQIKMITLLEASRTMGVFEYMSKDDIVDILGILPLNKRKELINLMRSGDKKIIQELLGYDERTAGGIMTTEYVAVSDSLTIQQTISKIKELALKTEVIDTIFVVNHKKELIGSVDLRDILVAPYQESLQHIMNENIISVTPETDQEKVSLLVSKYDLRVIPVVNKRNSLLGIITVDDIIDVIVEEYQEDMSHLAGTSVEETIYSPIKDSIKMRLPWLMVNLVTAFLASFTVSMFEGTIDKVTALAAAMPIVAGMGGNAGSQELSIIVRSIALGEASLQENWTLIFKKALLGIINGAIIGLFAGIILYFMYGNIYLGFIIFASMIANLVIAGVVGVLVPLTLKAFKVDPALASAVFVTTATDVLGFFIFLGLATLIIHRLV